MKHFILLSLALTLQAIAADWTQFRGPQGNGVSTDRNLPAKLSSDNLKWSISLPGRGLSGALVLGNKVILTCSSGPTQTPGRQHPLAPAILGYRTDHVPQQDKRGGSHPLQ